MQPEPTEISVYTDADWAGCRRSRKSTSGGVILLGRHCVKAWSKTQAVIAKSSAESELYSVIKGSCEGLGMQTLMDDLGVNIDINLHLDATAAKGILERSGLSKVRHIDVNHLWLQEQCARKIIPLTKVDGTKNPSDLLTKHLSVAVIEKHLECLNLQYREGRSEKAARLHVITEKKKSLSKIGKEKRQEDNVIQQGVFDFEKCKNDDWIERGENEKWCRWHRNPRRALFTPFKVARGPGRRTKLEATRVTEGINELGQRFRIEDDWRDPIQSHRILDTPWVGKTHFRVDPVEDQELGGDCRRQRDRAQLSSQHISSSQPPSARPRVSWADMDSE